MLLVFFEKNMNEGSYILNVLKFSMLSFREQSQKKKKNRGIIAS
jgi:hypothetical protein